MRHSQFIRTTFAVLAGAVVLAGCANGYGRQDNADWEARHAQFHRQMMGGYQADGACPFDGPGYGGPMGPGMGRGFGPGAGPGMGALTPEQYRAMMAAHVKNMPPELIKQRLEIMEMQMQVMREQLAAQPAPK